MKKVQSFILLGIIISNMQAQDFAMVGIPTVFNQTAFAARLAYLSNPAVGCEINNRFVKELNVLRFFGACPVSSGSLSGMYQTFGYASYREHCWAIALSKIITPRWALSLQAIPKLETFGKVYEPKFSMNLDATCFAKFSPNLFWDSELNIPIRLASNARNDAPLQSFLKMGLNYVFSKRCQAMVSVKQTLPYKAEVNLQLCYSPVSPLVFFGNVSSSSDCGFGFQYVFGRMSYRFQTCYRPVVGYSTNVGLSYSFQPSQKFNHHDS